MVYTRLGWFGSLHYFYLHWQGLYTITAVMCSSLNPMTHNRFDLYWLPCWLSIGSLLLSVGLLMRYLTQNKLATLALTCTFLVVYLYQVPNPAEAMYWMNSSLCYQLSANLGALLLLLVLKTFEQEQVRRVYWAAAALLTILLIGTNFITAMLAAFGIGIGFLLSLRNRATRLWWLALLGLAVIALAVVVLAPGNSIRMQKEASNAPALAIQVSAASKLVHGLMNGAALLAYSLVNWLGNGVLLAFSVLLVPLLAAVSSNPKAPINVFFNNRVALLLAGAAMVALPFVPTYIVQGSPPAGRVINVAYQVFILVWIFGLYAAVASLRRVAPGGLRQPAYITLAMAVFLLFALLTDANHALTYQRKGLNLNNIAVAYRDWLGGAASQFDQQQKKRYQLMNAPGHAGVVLDSLSATPPTIFLGDLHSDTTYYTNKSYAMFFGKDYVRVNKKTH